MLRAILVLTGCSADGRDGGFEIADDKHCRDIAWERAQDSRLNGYGAEIVGMTYC